MYPGVTERGGGDTKRRMEKSQVVGRTSRVLFLVWHGKGLTFDGPRRTKSLPVQTDTPTTGVGLKERVGVTSLKPPTELVTVKEKR